MKDNEPEAADVSLPGASPTSRLNVRHLEIFWAVMRSGNQHEAARLLGLSQPAVSKLLRYTEQRMGFLLFHRIKGRLHPTPEARVFYQSVDGIFGRLDAAERLARDLRRRLTGRITITTSSAFNQMLLPVALASFLRAHTLVQVGVKVLTQAEVMGRVANGEADLGLTFGPIEESSVDTHLLRTVAMVCALPHDDALAEQATISIADLHGERLITATERPLWGKLLEQAFVAAGDQPDIAVECTQSDLGFALAGTAIGLAVMPSVPLWPGVAGLAFRPLRPSIEVPVLALTGRDRPIPHAVAILVEELRHSVWTMEWAGLAGAGRSRPTGRR